MLQEPLTLYKLIVLYMLNRVNFPLTRTQISEFVLDRDYTNFLTLQQVFGELTDAALITARTVRNRTLIEITEDGRQTLEFFENRMNEEIRADIDEYLTAKGFALINDISIQGDYYKSTNGEFAAHLVAKERGVNLVDITLSVPTADIASAICDNWSKKNQEIYQYLVKELF